MRSPIKLVLPARRRQLHAIGLASAFALGGAFACSGETIAQGQLMLALQTEMSLPKDVSRVRIQILQNGNFKFDNTYNVGGPNDEKIPATLGIVSDGSDEPVEVRVLGFRGSEVRTLNKTITTVPDDRVALLRMPIQWLCEGMVRDLGNDSYESTCPMVDGQEASCLGGNCTPVLVRPDLLPNYKPEEVFGGGTGTSGSGECFATESCFDQGFDINPNMGDCSAEVMAGADDPLNFAVTTGPGGDGICSGPQCYVALDRDDGFGWREPARSGQNSGGTSTTDAGAELDTRDAGATDPGAGSDFDAAAPAPAPDASSGSADAPVPPSGLDPLQAGAPNGATLRRVELPRAVCERIADGRALGLRASRTCPTKTAANPPCGPWSSVGSGGGTTLPDGGGLPGGECAGFVPGQPVTNLTGDPLADSYLQAASELWLAAEQLKSMAASSCANVVTQLGGQTNIGNPPTNDEVSSTCANAASLLSQRGAANYAVQVSPAFCIADVQSQQDCESGCGAACGDVAPETRCDVALGPCAGECVGRCYPETDAVVQCSGACTGRCTGQCEGICSQTAGDGSCDGLCEGVCTGSCEGMCNVTGTLCTGTCHEDPSTSYDACAAGFNGPSDCAVALRPDACASSPCAEICASRAAVGQHCGITKAFMDADAPADISQAVSFNRGPLTDILLQSENLNSAGSYLSYATEPLINGSVGAASVQGCIALGSQVVSEAMTTINTAASSAASVVAYEGGIVPDGGTDGGVDYNCIAAGSNPLIDDFEDMDYVLAPNDGRNGAWVFGSDPSGTLTQGSVQALSPPRGGSSYGIHVAATGATQWGAGMTVNFVNTSCYDASVWTGLALWTYAAAPTTLQIRVSTVDSSAGCVPSEGSRCAFQTSVDTGPTWTQHHLLWSQFNSFDGDITQPAFDAASIVGIEIVQSTSEVDFWVDDVGFEGIPP